MNEPELSAAGTGSGLEYLISRPDTGPLNIPDLTPFLALRFRFNQDKKQYFSPRPIVDDFERCPA
jgi:hypothetical protein